MKLKDFLKKLGLKPMPLMKRIEVKVFEEEVRFRPCNKVECIYCWMSQVENSLMWFITFLKDQGAPGLNDPFKTFILRLFNQYFDSVQRIQSYLWCVAPQDIRDKHGMSNYPFLLAGNWVDMLRRNEKMHKPQKP